VAADNCAFEFGRNGAISASLRIDLGDEKVTLTTYLLSLCPDVTSKNPITKDDTSCRCLDAASRVGRLIFDDDELFPLGENLSQQDRPPSH